MPQKTTEQHRDRTLGHAFTQSVMLQSFADDISMFVRSRRPHLSFLPGSRGSFRGGVESHKQASAAMKVWFDP